MHTFATGQVAPFFPAFSTVLLGSGYCLTLVVYYLQPSHGKLAGSGGGWWCEPAASYLRWKLRCLMARKKRKAKRPMMARWRQVTSSK